MTNAAAFLLVCGWSMFPSQHRSTCVVALPGKSIRHPQNGIQAASLGLDLRENFSHSHMKILLLTLHRFFFFPNSVLLQLLKVKPFSAVHTIFFLLKKNPKKPKTKKPTVPVHTRILVLVRLLVIYCGE